jgi:hypothetical protein
LNRYVRIAVGHAMSDLRQRTRGIAPVPKVRPLESHALNRLLMLTFLVLTPSALFADTLTIAWDPVYDASLDGYRVYVGTSSRNYSSFYDISPTTTFTLMQVSPGVKYYFAVASRGNGMYGSMSSEVSGYSNQYPTIQNPGDRTSAKGKALTLQLAGSDPDGTPVLYSASGLPPGVLLTMSTGFIAGIPTTVGTYLVTVKVSDGVLSKSVSFTWTVSGDAHLGINGGEWFSESQRVSKSRRPYSLPRTGRRLPHCDDPGHVSAADVRCY